MTTPVKERLKTELEHAKEDGKQRAERISDILKAAASMTFEEIKGGSAELHVLTRKSLAELLEELQDASEADAEISAEMSDAVPVEPTDDATQTAPTWKELISHALEIVRDRKGDWFQQLKDYLNENAMKFDGDMTEEYGDRYLKVKSIFKRFVAFWEAARAQANTAKTESKTQPVDIEVVDGDGDTADTPETLQMLEPELQADQSL